MNIYNMIKHQQIAKNVLVEESLKSLERLYQIFDKNGWEINVSDFMKLYGKAKDKLSDFVICPYTFSIKNYLKCSQNL